MGGGVGLRVCRGWEGGELRALRLTPLKWPPASRTVRMMRNMVRVSSCAGMAGQSLFTVNKRVNRRKGESEETGGSAHDAEHGARLVLRRHGGAVILIVR
jgi:hypothetical protein